MQIGVQFYTLRDQCNTLEDFEKSLAKVADIGYKYVQISGVCPYEPQWLREQLDKNGLSCVITHSPLERMRDETEAVIADHNVFGCDYIGIGSGPNLLKSPEDMQQIIDLAHTAGRKMNAAGKRLMYHHHSPEFSRDYPDGLTRLEYLLANTTEEELGITYDTYWAQVGGVDVAAYLCRLKGRSPCIHLKDLVLSDWEQKMAPVGSGNLNWNAILEAAKDCDVKYALVEQDLCYDEDPFDCLKKSYDFLKAQGL